MTVLDRLRAGAAAAAGAVLHRSIRLTIDSADLRSIGREAVLAARADGRPLIFVGWHGHDFVNIGVYHPLFGFESKTVVMVTDSFRADILANAAQGLSVDVVHLGAPNSPQASRALVSVIRMVSHGHHALLAVDGPAGPARQVKPGAALIAQRAGAILVPTAIAAVPAVKLITRWDDHVVPLPGGRIMVHFGPLIDAAPPGEPAPDLDVIQARIGDALTTGTRIAEAACLAS